MKDEEIDRKLQAAQASLAPNPEGIKSVLASMKDSLRPVRPLPSALALTAVMILICVGVAVIGAARVGFDGIAKMNAWERAVIFPTLIFCICLAGYQFASAMIPGSRRRIGATGLLGICICIILGEFALLFHDYQTTNFLASGIGCLIAGLMHAIPALILCALVVRRGFAVDPVAAGLVAGTLAGIAGISLLELHCIKFEVTHLLVWHAGVILVSAVFGAFLGYILRAMRA